MAYNLQKGESCEFFIQAQHHLSMQLAKYNKAMRCSFNNCATAWTKQMAAVSRSLAETMFAILSVKY